MGFGLICTEPKDVSVIHEYSLGQLIKPLIREIFLLDTYLAGTSYVEDQERYAALQIDDELILKREPENEYDEMAILVLNSWGEKLGYVPRKDNIVFSRLMDAGKVLKARVKAIELGDFGVWEVEMEIFLVDL